MSNIKKVTFCAMMTALACVFMLSSYFPYFTYVIAQFAGLFIMVAVIEIDLKWATLAYIASSIIIAIIAEPEAKMLYILFFGYYPIVKVLLERTKSRVLEYILKFALFNIAIIFAYAVVAQFIGVELENNSTLGNYFLIVLLLMGNVIFPIYDIAVSRVASLYMYRLHPTVSKIIKGK